MNLDEQAAGACDFCLILRRTSALMLGICPETPTQLCKICRIYLEKLKNEADFRLDGTLMFHHIVAARYCGSVREAAALPGRFLPELGRFGIVKAAFFFLGGSSVE